MGGDRPRTSLHGLDLEAAFREPLFDETELRHRYAIQCSCGRDADVSDCRWARESYIHWGITPPSNCPSCREEKECH